VVFDPLDNAEDIALVTEAQSLQPTYLSAWFDLNAVDDFARSLTYVEIPTWYAWQATNHSWKRRTRRLQVLGRLYPVDPSQREAWAMRVLLLHSRGCTSAESIRTIFGEVRPTFVEAAKAAGLLDDDQEYIRCLAIDVQGAALRSLLLIIIIHCSPNDPMMLINSAFDRLTVDFIGNPEHRNVQLFDYIGSLVDVPFDNLLLEPPSQYQRTRSVNQFLENFVSSPILQAGTLNVQQQLAHDSVLNSIDSGAGLIFALLAPAGTGKTFLINAILATARQHGKRVVASASSGLAASLLGHSRTAHSTFKIPVHVDEECTCRPSAAYKQWLKTIDCFIWDEISMAHRWAIDAVDRLLQDLRGCR
jgi:hypothetical protein